jgi:3-dehydroquinate synthase
MVVVPVELPHHRYDIVIEPGLLEHIGERVYALAPHDRCALLADGRVLPLHGDALRTSLESAGYDPVVATIPPGEEEKSLSTVAGLYEVLLDHHLERGSPLIALGGGVTGDMVGFVAATYLRGVPFVQCPTTLLSMVDASVGGKTGVNLPQGKNLVGAFHQPIVVLIDPLMLGTLPARELRCGLAECIKHAVIRDAALFDYIGENLKAILQVNPAVLVELVRQNVEIKAAVVVEDEREKGVRAHLNFGHTFAHAIEVTSGYGHVQHGEAVGLGMLAASRTAAEFGLCAAALHDRLRELIEAAGLPVKTELAMDDELMRAMQLDKKAVGGRMRLVLPDRIGSVVIRDQVPESCVRAGWEAIRS